MAKQKVTTTTKVRVKRNGSTNGSGYKQCNICHGTGVVKSKDKSK